MARHDIRGLKIQDGTYVLTSKDIYNLNDNFIQISQEVFGTSSFAKKIDKEVKKNTTAIEEMLVDIGDLDEGLTQITASVDEVQISFQKVGGKNLLVNSGFVNEGEEWTISEGSASLGVRFSSQYPDMPSGCTTILKLENGIINSLSQEITSGFARETRDFTFSGFIRNTSTTVGITNPYAGIEVRMEYVDGSSPNYFALVEYDDNDYIWKKFSKTITVTKEVLKMRVSIIARDMDGLFYASSIVAEEGVVAHSWSNADNEAYSTYHTFTPEGYSIRDSNGETLLTPNGMANEQNIGRVDNVEDGYPMRLPFNIGTEVSQITQAVLKWDISAFRTYSKGAASGGGSTSGSGGSWSDTVGVYGWTQGLGVDTDGRTIDTNNLGVPHSHYIATSKLGHSHSVAIPNHSHSTPNHAHTPEYGILTTPVTSSWFSIYIDGTYRTAVEAVRGEVDLSAWITTNGWHTIELRVTSLKRIDANLYLKTYIRR